MLNWRVKGTLTNLCARCNRQYKTWHRWTAVIEKTAFGEQHYAFPVWPNNMINLVWVVSSPFTQGQLTCDRIFSHMRSCVFSAATSISVLLRGNMSRYENDVSSPLPVSHIGDDCTIFHFVHMLSSNDISVARTRNKYIGDGRHIIDCLHPMPVHTTNINSDDRIQAWKDTRTKPVRHRWDQSRWHWQHYPCPSTPPRNPCQLRHSHRRPHAFHRTWHQWSVSTRPESIHDTSTDCRTFV